MFSKTSNHIPIEHSESVGHYVINEHLIILWARPKKKFNLKTLWNFKLENAIKQKYCERLFQLKKIEIQFNSNRIQLISYFYNVSKIKITRILMFRSLSSSWASFVTTFIIISMVILPSLVFAQFEICDNGIDDDNDSLIDLNDDDCDCVVVEPISLIPNPSFEDMECCPSDRSQLDCATDWIQASEPTTDYINTCGWFGWEQFPPPTPIPDGNGIMGFRDGRVRGNNDGEPQWKEYAGACLTNPLLADSTYRFQFDVGFVNNQVSPPINISFFGTTDCVNLPFGVGNQAFGCPTNGPNWVKLGDVAVSGNNGNVWVNTFIETTPDEDIYAIAIGPDCPAVISPVSLYYFFDNLILADIELFDLLISESTHPCNSDYNLSVPNNPEFEYQWYKEGIAVVGETNSE